MKFNSYLWDLYKGSKRGTEFIEFCKQFNFKKAYDTIVDKEIGYYLDQLTYYKNDDDKESSVIYEFDAIYDILNKSEIIDKNKIFEELYDKGLESEGEQIIAQKDAGDWLSRIPDLSLALYRINPNYYFPYFFSQHYNDLEKILLEYEVPLPDLPKKKFLEARLFHYIAICNGVHEFRQMNNLSPEELCAFIYDFAKNIVKLRDENNELPEPTRSWFVGGHRGNFEWLDAAANNDRDNWQCNTDTRPGDIVVMYCLTPRSYIHSIWRAVTDGFIDPFFWYYQTVYISNPIKLDKPITIDDLKSNEVWSQCPLVRKNLQGINGYSISWDNYEELLRMIEQNGQSLENFPRIKRIEKLHDRNLEDERDVEIYLVEPLLDSLGYKSKDWIRQMPIKMGRGVSYYPDYCFGAVPKRGEEKAKMVLETKYAINNNKELQEAYYQAKSYAIRLQAGSFTIASKEGIWVYYLKHNNFKLDYNYHFNWNEIDHPDAFNHLESLIGRKKILS